MTSKAARYILLACRPNGEDADEGHVRKAMAVAEKDPVLLEEFEAQTTFDRASMAGLMALPPPAEEVVRLREYAESFKSVKKGGFSFLDPAMLAVGIGFLLLVALLVWRFMGSAGVFPEEAVKIAQAGAWSKLDQFEEVNVKAGSLEDWFMLKGFDRFHVPPGFENYDVVGVRIFRVENEPIAAAAVPENQMFFLIFNTVPFGISSGPSQGWRVGEKDGIAMALHVKKDTGFLLVMKGTKGDLERVLAKAAAEAKK